MSLPTFSIGVAFGNDPGDDSPTFVDVSADLEKLSVRRGRQTEQDQAQVGTMTATLLDDARAYDPNYAAGPHYPNVKPVKPLRVQATLDSVVYPVFRGWGDLQNSWVRDETDPHAATVVHQANDGFDYLNVSGIYIFTFFSSSKRSMRSIY